MNVLNTKQIVLIIFCVGIFSYIMTFIAKKVAFHVNAIDIPNERKVHKKPMPRLGGLAIYIAFLFGYMVFGKLSIQMNSILIAGFLIVLVGIFDDIKPIKARYKLLVQILSASILVFYGKVLLSQFSIFGLSVDLGWMSSIVTIIFIVGIINAINLIDGLDGLASGTCLIFFITILIIALIKGSFSMLILTLILIMIGSITGFWFHNFYPAKIFAGDSGSMFMGFMIATVSLLGFKTAALTSLIIPILLLAIPLLDTVCAIIRRLIKHQPIFFPDKNHLHHQLLNLGLSHRNTVLAIYAMNILFSVTTILYVANNSRIAKYAYVVILLLIVWLFTKTGLVKEHKKK